MINFYGVIRQGRMDGTWWQKMLYLLQYAMFLRKHSFFISGIDLDTCLSLRSAAENSTINTLFRGTKLVFSILSKLSLDSAQELFKCSLGPRLTITVKFWKFVFTTTVYIQKPSKPIELFWISKKICSLSVLLELRLQNFFQNRRARPAYNKNRHFKSSEKSNHTCAKVAHIFFFQGKWQLRI